MRVFPHTDYFPVQLINELGFTPIASQGLTVAPYAVGWFMVFFQAWHSDRTRDRGYHIMLSTAISVIGYIVLASLATKGNASNFIGGRYFALFLVVGGLYSLFPLVMSWAANVFSPTSKRGVGTAFIVSISNCVSMWVSTISLAQRRVVPTKSHPIWQCLPTDLLRRER